LHGIDARGSDKGQQVEQLVARLAKQPLPQIMCVAGDAIAKTLAFLFDDEKAFAAVGIGDGPA
jgi:hypothetical protein